MVGTPTPQKTIKIVEVALKHPLTHSQNCPQYRHWMTQSQWDAGSPGTHEEPEPRQTHERHHTSHHTEVVAHMSRAQTVLRWWPTIASTR